MILVSYAPTWRCVWMCSQSTETMNSKWNANANTGVSVFVIGRYSPVSVSVTTRPHDCENSTGVSPNTGGFCILHRHLRKFRHTKSSVYRWSIVVGSFVTHCLTVTLLTDPSFVTLPWNLSLFHSSHKTLPFYKSFPPQPVLNRSCNTQFTPPDPTRRGCLH